MKIPLSGTTQKGKKPEFDNPEFAAQIFRSHERWICYIEEWQDSKSKRQLGYWHTAFIQSVQDAEKELGNIYSHESIHWLIKSQCPLLQGVVCEETTGEIVIRYIRSFADLTKKELSEVMDWCFQWAAEKYGVVIPDAMRK